MKLNIPSLAKLLICSYSYFEREGMKHQSDKTKPIFLSDW